jgi:SAM-dependent methyltransferase
MKRNFLFAWYQTPRGKLLQQLEADYLQRSITVSCQQTILQIGGLDWENEFIDCLPLQSNSVDMIIVPHLLEFDAKRFQTIREVERVLKPEGVLIVLNFNPWSLWVRYQYLWDKKMADTWGGHFIPRSRILDWLKVLNFEVTVTSEFHMDLVSSTHGTCMAGLRSFTSTAYAIKAIKRRYNLIPLTPVQVLNPRLVVANSLRPSRLNKHE